MDERYPTLGKKGIFEIDKFCLIWQNKKKIGKDSSERI
jgi:hypothetical protein